MYIQAIHPTHFHLLDHEMYDVKYMNYLNVLLTRGIFMSFHYQEKQFTIFDVLYKCLSPNKIVIFPLMNYLKGRKPLAKKSFTLSFICIDLLEIYSISLSHFSHTHMLVYYC